MKRSISACRGGGLRPRRVGLAAINPIRQRRSAAAAQGLRLTATLPPFNASKKIAFVQPPHPGWRPGAVVPSPSALHEEEAESMTRRRWDAERLSKEKGRILESAIVPRPLALISSMSAFGNCNLALSSYFSIVSHNPPMLSLSLPLCPETRANILDTGQLTINLVDEAAVEAAHSTSVPSASYVDEWVVSGLSKEPSRLVRPPLVRECPIGLECEVYSSQDICVPNTNDVATTVVLASIKYMHVRPDVLDAGEEAVDLSAIQLVGKLGGDAYVRLMEAFSLPVPSRSDPHEGNGRFNGLLG